MLDENDGGYASRKLWVLIGSIVVLTATAIVGAIWPGLVPIYPTFVAGIVSLVTVYFGANAATKFITGSVNAKQMAVDPTAVGKT